MVVWWLIHSIVQGAKCIQYDIDEITLLFYVSFIWFFTQFDRDRWNMKRFETLYFQGDFFCILDLQFESSLIKISDLMKLIYFKNAGYLEQTYEF